MKRFFISLSLFIFVFFAVTLLTLYIQRNSRPMIFCTSLDDSIRPRDYCLMNPFRDKRPEALAEKILQELKNGNTNSIVPYINDYSENNKNRFLENETKYKIKSWRVGNRKDSEDKIYVSYWAARENYPIDVSGSDILEEVTFGFAREGNEVELRHFSAIY